ncbi:MAG TPA: hypothetical protein VG713_03425, partial [Pirellulales bacterium]|nr:hypothetical protein [Pirellulales bacterium]
ERAMNVTRQPRPLPPPTAADESKDAISDLNRGVLVRYCDGFEAAVLNVGNTSNRWNFACQVAGESQPRATAMFNGPWGNRNLFKALSHAIQRCFIDNREQYPVERTLLATGAIEAAMQSQAAGRPIDTPHLHITYRPVDFSALRENGKSWQILTADTPQPTDFVPGDVLR